MLVELGVWGSIVGHSERRQLFCETDEALARKVPAALDAGLTPILCVGESESERDGGETEAVLRRQVEADLAQVADDELAEVVIAYEPVWAIGTGRTATAEQAEEAIGFIRSLVGDRDAEAAARMRIIYGGSVKPANAAELISRPEIDGALVGGACLDPGRLPRDRGRGVLMEELPEGRATLPCPRWRWSCSTAGGWPRPARETRSSRRERRSSTSSRAATRRRGCRPAAATSACRRGRWATRRSAT